MEISHFKKNVIQILFALAVLLLAANVIVAKLTVKDEVVKDSDPGSNLIDQKFLNDLNDFGIKKEWVRKLSSDDFKGKSYSYKVQIPKDLPIPVVLSEVYGSFYTSDVTINTFEKIIGGKTVLNIYRSNNLKLTAEFNYDDKIRRDAGNVGLIVYGIDQLNSKEAEAIIKFPQSFVAAILPSKTAPQLAANLTSNRKRYAILINDDIKDLDFQLSRNFSPYRLKTVVASIIGTFPDAAFFMIDDNSKLYSSPAFQIINNEFLKRNINLRLMSSQREIPDASSAKVKSEFRNFVTSTRMGVSKIISIHADDFENLTPEIFSLIKIGYKFVNPVLIMNPGSKDLPLKP